MTETPDITPAEMQKKFARTRKLRQEGGSK